MPTFPLISAMVELPRALELVQMGMKFFVPLPVMLAVETADCEEELTLAAPLLAVAVVGLASSSVDRTYSEAGRPPSVSASAAFKAYGTLSSNARGCSGCPSACTPNQRASPEANKSMGNPSDLPAPSRTM